jgi:hypothetical protein
VPCALKMTATMRNEVCVLGCVDGDAMHAQHSRDDAPPTPQPDAAHVAADDASTQQQQQQQPQPPPPPPPPHERALATLSEHLQFHRDQGLAWAPQHMDVCMRAALTSAAERMASSHGQQHHEQQHEQQHHDHHQQQGALLDGVTIALGVEEWTKRGGGASNPPQWVVQVGLVAISQHAHLNSSSGSSSAEDAWESTPCHVLALEDAAPAALRGELLAGLARGACFVLPTGGRCVVFLTCNFLS